MNAPRDLPQAAINTGRPNSELNFINARLVLPGEVVEGSLQVRNGLISAIDSGGIMNSGGEDLEGDYLLPGLVEIHTDNFERHLMPRPKVNWAELPALLAHDAEIAAAGITTVFDAFGRGRGPTPTVSRGTSWNGVVGTLQSCIQHGLLEDGTHAAHSLRASRPQYR